LDEGKRNTYIESMETLLKIVSINARTRILVEVWSGIPSRFYFSEWRWFIVLRSTTMQSIFSNRKNKISFFSRTIFSSVIFEWKQYGFSQTFLNAENIDRFSIFKRIYSKNIFTYFLFFPFFEIIIKSKNLILQKLTLKEINLNLNELFT